MYKQITLNKSYIESRIKTVIHYEHHAKNVFDTAWDTLFVQKGAYCLLGKRIYLDESIMQLKNVIKRETVRQYKEKIREEEERIRKLENSSMFNSEGKFHQRHFERAVHVVCGFLLYTLFIYVVKQNPYPTEVAGGVLRDVVRTGLQKMPFGEYKQPALRDTGSKPSVRFSDMPSGRDINENFMMSMESDINKIINTYSIHNVEEGINDLQDVMEQTMKHYRDRFVQNPFVDAFKNEQESFKSSMPSIIKEFPEFLKPLLTDQEHLKFFNDWNNLLSNNGNSRESQQLKSEITNILTEKIFNNEDYHEKIEKMKSEWKKLVQNSKGSKSYQFAEDYGLMSNNNMYNYDKQSSMKIENMFRLLQVGNLLYVLAFSSPYIAYMLSVITNSKNKNQKLTDKELKNTKTKIKYGVRGVIGSIPLLLSVLTSYSLPVDPSDYAILEQVICHVLIYYVSHSLSEATSRNIQHYTHRWTGYRMLKELKATIYYHGHEGEFITAKEFDDVQDDIVFPSQYDFYVYIPGSIIKLYDDPNKWVVFHVSCAKDKLIIIRYDCFNKPRNRTEDGSNVSFDGRIEFSIDNYNEYNSFVHGEWKIVSAEDIEGTLIEKNPMHPGHYTTCLAYKTHDWTDKKAYTISISRNEITKIEQENNINENTIIDSGTIKATVKYNSVKDQNNSIIELEHDRDCLLFDFKTKNNELKKICLLDVHTIYANVPEVCVENRQGAFTGHLKNLWYGSCPKKMHGRLIIEDFTSAQSVYEKRRQVRRRERQVEDYRTTRRHMRQKELRDRQRESRRRQLRDENRRTTLRHTRQQQILENQADI